MSVVRRKLVLLAAFALWLAPSQPALGDKADAKPARVEKAAENARARLGALLKKKGMRFGQTVYLRAFKEEAQLEVWLKPKDRFELLKTYEICAASGELGPKQKVGDEQVPEGFYAVGPGAMNPASKYHLSFNVGYPNAFDKKLARTGSLIMVHGDCVSIGCMAMTDDGIDEIYTLVDAAHDAGQTSVPIHIFPFRFTEANLKKHQKSEWISFWKNLKEGDDLFEQERLPPTVSHARGRYTFRSAKDD